MTLLYLVALLIALTGMVVLDRRFRLFFWNDARRAAVVLLAGVAFFLIWDFAGVGGGIFFRGETSVHDGPADRTGDPARGGLLPHAALLPHDECLRLRVTPEDSVTYWTLNAIFSP